MLLPMYRILNTMSPESCDISIGDHCDNANLANTSEVNSLFGEESSPFQLDEAVPVESITSSVNVNSPPSRKSKTEEDAQCEHLLSLGLCRISSIKSNSSTGEVCKSKIKRNISKRYSKTTTDANCEQVSRVVQSCIDDKKYLCKICQLHLKTKDSLRVHMQCHKDDGGFKCLYCECYISEWNLMEKHIHTHRNLKRNFKCQVCGKKYRTLRAWKSHMRSHDRKNEFFMCTKCHLSFENEQIRNLHVTCHHDDVFKCWQCGFVDCEWIKIYKHLCVHDSTLQPYICSLCNQRFYREAPLKAHLAKHKTSKPVVCPICDRIFKSEYQMTMHQKDFHQKQNICYSSKKKKTEDGVTVAQADVSVKPLKNLSRDYSCDICSRKCSSKLALQRHMGVHVGEKPFKCQLCEYKTRLKASLTQHMRIHTGEKPFKCKVCSYASIDASSLRRHTRTHTSEKPYKCQHCSYSCIQKKSLDLHIRRHHTQEKFDCFYCHYSSPDKQLVQKHTKKYHSTENISKQHLNS
ncbi:hypothetical protein GDO86_011302 [Hymenochirus boettgeri]|uniref:C2H2-type domain-containing protein n=1 Tax=Hymenochirus boettgeri TaxID=247094 RepID=A0A8T2JB73_9PIPI|nr:hypothetical protein GDO86_011302 [Hymenochirus boettgeri]